jgi:hypothetical protein
MENERVNERAVGIEGIGISPRADGMGMDLTGFFRVITRRGLAVTSQRSLRSSTLVSTSTRFRSGLRLGPGLFR